MKKNRRLNNEEFVELAQSLLGNAYDYLTEYTGSTCKMKFRCKKHDIAFEQSATNHIRIRNNGSISTGCYKCKKEKISKTTEYFISKAKETHGDRYDYSKVNYTKNNIKVEIICKKHGAFLQRPSDHITNGQNCPKCNLSKGEEKILLFLKNNKINFEPQKSFDDLKSPKTGYNLFYDFFIPDKQTLIEFDGLQHFVPMAHKEGIKKHSECLLSDAIKNEYANRNNIKLIRIPYTNYDKIEEILNSLLQTIC